MKIFVDALLGEKAKAKILGFVQLGLDLFSFKLSQAFAEKLGSNETLPIEKVQTIKVKETPLNEPANPSYQCICCLALVVLLFLSLSELAVGPSMHGNQKQRLREQNDRWKGIRSNQKNPQPGIIQASRRKRKENVRK